MTTSSAGPAPGTLPPRAGRLATELESWPRRTVSLAELWALFAIADPASVTRPSGRADLAATLRVLADAGVLTMSRTLDRSARPELPTRLTLPAQAATATAAELARRVPWRPELAWATSARLTVGQVGALQSVNTWLRDRGRDDDELPTRERSLELFGFEKRLDLLLSTSLFATDRLSLRLLRTFRSHPPLPVRRVGRGSLLLVVENADTFHSLRASLAREPGAVGLVAWGGGGSFEASVRGIAELPGVTDVAYFGDVDPDGLRIPSSAALTAASEGLPAVRPARALYARLLELGVPQPGQMPVTLERATELADWLGESLAGQAAAMLLAGVRLPQEAMSGRVLAADSSWAEDLRVAKVSHAGAWR